MRQGNASLGFRSFDFREVTEHEFAEAFPVLRELRENLRLTEFVSIYREARRADGYTLLGVYEGVAGAQKCVALMGYRILADFVHGRHLYVDDLVVTTRLRSSGLGAELLKRAEKIAAESDCRGLRLCTGVQNERGIKFYEREGWTARALAFKKTLG